jgi:hypothetical protein
MQHRHGTVMPPTDIAAAQTVASSLLDAHGGSRAARIARHLAHALDETGDTSAADHWRAVLDLTGGGESPAGS